VHQAPSAHAGLASPQVELQAAVQNTTCVLNPSPAGCSGLYSLHNAAHRMLTEPPQAARDSCCISLSREPVQHPPSPHTLRQQPQGAAAMTNIQLLTTAGQDEKHLILRLTLLSFIASSRAPYCSARQDDAQHRLLLSLSYSKSSQCNHGYHKPGNYCLYKLSTKYRNTCRPHRCWG